MTLLKSNVRVIMRLLKKFRFNERLCKHQNQISQNQIQKRLNTIYIYDAYIVYLNF